jgi:hypothetical protein
MIYDSERLSIEAGDEENVMISMFDFPHERQLK